MDNLPANYSRSRKDAFHMLALLPLEMVTRSLMKGDAWELKELTQFVNRSRALVNAYDKRMGEAE